jgi:uncharacterized phage-associated protein
MKVSDRDPLMAYAADFYPNKDRILAAILFLMRIKNEISQYQIVKSIFIADKAHLNQVGRPITFDKYVAMKQGPVPSLVYGLLMEASLFRQIYHRDPPWQIKVKGKGNRYIPTEGPDMDVLSVTDTRALREGLDTVRRLNPDQLEKILHEDPAYIEAWKRRGRAGSVPMKAVKLLEDENEEKIADLADISYP